MSSKITVEYLSEDQMREVRRYLARMPNKPHEIKSGIGSFTDPCGNYIKVHVNKVAVSVDEHTAKLDVPVYEKVTFSAPLSYVERSACGDTYREFQLNKTQLKERKQVVKGLVALIGTFVIEK